MADMGMKKVTFESDYKLMVDKLNSFDTRLSELGSIILQCKNLLVQNPHYTIQFVTRHANVVDHTLARGALAHARLKVYIPSCNFD